METKPCVKCGSTRRAKPRPGTKTGHCIDCANARSKKWEKNNRERVKEVQINYKKNNLETWKASKIRSTNKERVKKPVEYKARQIIRAAVTRGDLPRVATCDCIDCGIQAVDYHHEDYSKPLEVEPLCRMCHIKRHNPDN